MTTKHCSRGSWDRRLIPLLHNLVARKRRSWMIAYGKSIAPNNRTGITFISNPMLQTTISHTILANPLARIQATTFEWRRIRSARALVSSW
mgnify:CR=1 FL=1